MKYKVGSFVFILLAILIGCSSSAFAAASASVELVAQDITAYQFDSGAADEAPTPLLKFKVINTGDAIQTITGFTPTYAVGTVGLAAADVKYNVYRDVNQNGILDPNDLKLIAASVANANTLPAATETLVLGAPETVAIGGTTQYFITAELLFATGTLADGDAIKLTMNAAGVVGGVGVVVSTTTSLDPSAVANVPSIVIANAPGTITIANAATLSDEVVGNQKQTQVVASFKLTADGATSHILNGITIADGGWTTVADAGADINNAYLYLDLGTVGAFDVNDVLIKQTNLATVTNAFALGTALTIPQGTSRNFLLVFDMSGTAGVAGQVTEAAAKENLAVDVAAAGVALSDAGVVGGAYAGPTVGMAPLFVTAVSTVDNNHDGLIEAVKVTFSDNITDSRWEAMNRTADYFIEPAAGNNALGGGDDATISAFNGTVLGDVANNNVVYIEFTPSSMGAADRYTNGVPQIGVVSSTIINSSATKTLLPFTAYNNGATAGELKVVTTDAASPVVYGANTSDVNGNGKIDRIVVSFSEPMSGVVADAFPGVTFTSVVPTFGSSGTYTPSSAAVAGSTIYYTIGESAAGVFDTESIPSFNYNPTTGNLKDANGVEILAYGAGGLSQQSVTVDNAAPVIVASYTQDNYWDDRYAGASKYEAAKPDGRIDTLKLIFSEKVTSANYSATVNDANLNGIINQFAVIHPGQGALTKFQSPAVAGTNFNPAPSIVSSGTDDTESTMLLYVQEASVGGAGMLNGGDTGTPFTWTYAGIGAVATTGMKDMAGNGMLDVAVAVASTDDADPFIVDGIYQQDGATLKDITADAEIGGWAAQRFSNVTTVDSNKAGSADFNTGDGYIDAFRIAFTENVHIADATNLGAGFTVAQASGFSAITLTGVDADGNGTVTAADNNVAFANAIFYGTSTKVVNKWDTGETPTVKYNGGLTIYDGANTSYEASSDNVLQASAAKKSFDKAKPVVVKASGSVETKNISITWSEPVFSDGVGTALANAAWAANNVFGYQDKNAAGAASLDAVAANFLHDTATNTTTIQTNVAMTVADVEQDSVWVKYDARIYDNADAAASFKAGFAENGAGFDLIGVGFKMSIDDKIAPWITAAVTVDANGDGKVDHIRFTFSENIKDTTVNGYVANNMGTDVSANWVLSGYSGTAKFNFFDGVGITDATKVAANAAGQPVFGDNDADDNVLYLALEADKVPASVTGLGSTDFRPVITWSGNTTADKKPNFMETNAAHFNGQVTDNVGPVLMAAEYTSTSTMKVTFSEDVDAATVAKTDIAWTMSNAGTGYQANVVQITEPAAGSFVFRTTSVFSWASDMAGTLGLNAGAIADPDLDGTGVDPAAAAVGSSIAAAYPTATFYNADKTVNAAAGTSKAAVAITINLTGGENPGGEVSSVTKAALNAVASNLSISNKNVTRVYFNGTAAANDTVLVKLVDADGDAVETTVVANGVGNFSGQIDASALHNGQVTIQAGKAVAGVVSAWYTGASYAKETIEVGAPAELVVTDVANDQGGFVDVTFTKSENDVANPSDFYAVDYYVIQGKKGDNWFTVNTLLPDGNTDTTYRAANVYVGSIDSLRINAHVKLNGASKVADAPDAMSSAYAFGTGTAIDNILPGAFVGFTADGTQGTGVNVQWTAPADHGLFNAQYNVWGVDGYEVYRRVVGTTEYTLAGTVAPGATQFVDTVANGSTVYEYMVKAVDGSQFVITSISKAMASKGADFTGDGVVSLGDLVLLGSNWDLKSTDADFVVNYDLNKDGVISLGDLVLLGNAWDQAAKVAKAAGEMPVASNVAFQMVPTSSENGSMYYVSISTQNAADIKGVAFGLTYDASKFEFVPETVTGLVDMQVVKPGQGIISIASLYNSDTFSGTITLGFKSKGMNSSMNVEMVNAEVAMNGALYAVGNAAGVTLKALPSTYALSQNFPNPFNPTTTIEYSIPTTGNVSLVVYNVAGQKVRTLVNDSQSANFYKVVWDGKNDNGMTVGTGTYFYKLVSGNYSKIVKMTLMK